MIKLTIKQESAGQLGEVSANITETERKVTAWLCREMPAGTVIGDPAWWAPKIIAALSAPPDAQPVAWMLTADQYRRPAEFHREKPSFVPPICKLIPLYDHPSTTTAPASESTPKLNWNEVSAAANAANQAFGQWMPQQWVQAFVKAYNKE